MTPPDLRELAREAAQVAKKKWPYDHSCIDTGTSCEQYIADAVLSAIEPAIRADERARALEEAARIADNGGDSGAEAKAIAKELRLMASETLSAAPPQPDPRDERVRELEELLKAGDAALVKVARISLESGDRATAVIVKQAERVRELETQVEKLEAALREACDHLEGAVQVIEDYDSDDIDGENADERESIARLRAIAGEPKP